MKNFKYILISSIIIFVLNFPAHFVFGIIPSDITAIFFPTNESIFQHMKMMFTCCFIFHFVLFFIRRKFHFENVFLTCLISSISSIAFFLVIFIPVYLRFGEHMIFTFILLLISILFGQYLSYPFLEKPEYKQLEIMSVVLLAIIFVIGGYLTFHPIKNFFFWDPEKETYERVYK